MNKQKFNDILSNYQQISAEDRQALHLLVKEYPYSQILHTLVAKANLDAKTNIATQTLNFAAMYATDRLLLKSILAPQTATQKAKPKPALDKEVATVAKKKIQTKITVDTGHYGSDASENLRDEFLEHLNNLKASKANYLQWLDKVESEEVKDVSEEKAKPKKTTSTVKKEVTKNKPSEKEENKGLKTEAKKKNQSAAKAKTTSTKTSAKKETKVKTTKVSIKKKAEPKARPVKPKLEEQIEIIDKFIDKVPSISAKKVTVVSQSQEDLSVPSTQFGDDLVSENLAVILVGQGKVEKAIDMYKKLIWKFPQKKAYFAAQIEELTK